MHLDWTSTFRVSDVAAAHMWATLQSLVRNPEQDKASAEFKYARIQKFVKEHMLDKVMEIPVCPCGKVIYHDFRSAKVRNAYEFCGTRRLACPLCGESKFVPGTQTPRKKVYYVSPEYWLRDLYQRKDMARAMANDVNPADTPVGSIHRSQGYKEKVTDNPLMNEDPRHAALVGLADGGPFYKDKNAGSGWFFMLRHTGLPTELLLEPALAHMPLFIGCHHYHTDEHGVTKRRKRSVTTLYGPIMAIPSYSLPLWPYHLPIMAIPFCHAFVWGPLWAQTITNVRHMRVIQGPEGCPVRAGGAGRRPVIFVQARIRGA
jgi:hypothetical protein